ncbi:MAG: DMSO reductase [Gammaproteobacteria bacterium]|nr:MAG: DMSO reductase [Gammaproteobacteria bacterium]RKZ76152.1 MAG: DMSO reductase [Gammaproteobacteria bacterium]
MHPAFSVIFLTTLIGVGQGLFLALYTGQIYSMMKLLPAQDSQSFYAVGSLLALGLLVAGLFASFFHLGRPMRAWRSSSKWRTSWLSREVIILPTTMLLIAFYGAIHYFGWTQPLFTVAQTQPIDLSLIIGALATLSTLTLFICTSMIYASLRFLQEWNNPLTVINYILLGTASGFTLAAVFSVIVGANVVGFYIFWSIILTIAGFISRAITLQRNRRLTPKSNLQTAIGMRHTVIAQKAQGAMGGSFNTREFFHHKSLTQLKNIKNTFLLFVFPIPICLLLAAASGLAPLYFAVAAFVIQYFGLMAERWYFFTEGRHPQNIYYQSVA